MYLHILSVQYILYVIIIYIVYLALNYHLVGGGIRCRSQLNKTSCVTHGLLCKPLYLS